MRCIDKCVILSVIYVFFFFNDTATTEIYTLSLHDALPIFFELAQRSRKLVQEEAKPRLQQLYGEVLSISRAVVREAKAAVESIEGQVSSVGAGLVQQIRQTVEIVSRVIGQTRARVFKGDTHYPGKVLS